MVGDARRVLTCFIDGLRFDSVENMPFVSSLASRRPMRTLLGYSITCHASMYSGLYPDRHGMWFFWRYDPGLSPFRWLPGDRVLRAVDSVAVRYGVARVTRRLARNTSYGGLPVMWRSSLANWRYLAPAEDRLWPESGYLGRVPTIFERLSDASVSWEAVGLVDSARSGGSLRHLRDYEVPRDPPRWTYLFVGELDTVSHTHGQDSPEAKTLMRRIDREILRVFETVTARTGEEPLVMVVSDHGHVRVEGKLDLRKRFSEHGLDLRRFVNVVDTNFARFWFRSAAEERAVMNVLGACPEGWVLSEGEMRHYRAPSGRLYGDAVFYLDRPYMFEGTVWGDGTRTMSIHGYLPDYAEKDGVFAANAPISRAGHVELTDVAPSLSSALGVAVPDDLDGRDVW